MKKPVLPILILLSAALLRADTFDEVINQMVNQQAPRSRQEAKAPKIDAKTIINESNSFLKEREPEMTSEEYALHEKIVNLLASNPEFAIRLLEAMVNEKEKPSPAFEFILGNAYYRADQLEKAEAGFRSAVTRYPTFLRAWNNLGVLYYTSERYADAIPCFSKAVVLGDKDPTTFGLLGFCLEKTGNVVSAEMSYMQALAGDPSSIDWKEGLLRIYIEGRQYGRAESLVRSLIKDRPSETRYWLAYGNVLLSSGQKLKAISMLELASHAKLAGPDEMLLLGDLYAEQHLIPEAIASYRRVFDSQRQMGERKLLQFAQVLVGAGQIPQARSVMTALGEKPSAELQLIVAQTRADILLAENQWKEARLEVEKLLALAPMNGRALLTLGKSYLGEDDLGRASLAFEAAYQIPATAYPASLELANIEIKNRHYAKSAEYLEKALSIEKTDAVADLLAKVKLLFPRDA
jgi:tetratricopeptide (TPR) repeat protein